MTLYRNYYRCRSCNVSWDDYWSCQCDDECPKCGADYTPYDSDELEDDEEDMTEEADLVSVTHEAIKLMEKTAKQHTLATAYKDLSVKADMIRNRKKNSYQSAHITMKFYDQHCNIQSVSLEYSSEKAELLYNLILEMVRLDLIKAHKDIEEAATELKEMVK